MASFTVTGTLKKPDGVTPVSGVKVYFRPVPRFIPSGSDLLVSSKVVSTDSNGQFTVSLTAIDGVKWFCSSQPAVFDPFHFDSLASGTTKDLTLLTPVPATTALAPYLQGSASDSAMAAAISTTGSASQTALNNLYATKAQGVLAAAAGPEAVSRGADLVTNGTGYLGTNRNFSGLTYTGSDAPPGLPGSFVCGFTGYKIITSDDFIPVDPTRKYILSAWARETQTTGVSKFYAGMAAYDNTGIAIQPYMYYYNPATSTTLAAPLNPGDTTATVTSAANWSATAPNNYFLAWNYQDPSGRVWPAGTFSRNVRQFSAVSGNTITFATPWAGPALASGAPVVSSKSGSTYQYTITGAAAAAAAAWTKYTSNVTTGNIDGTGSTAQSNAFPPGTAKIRIVFLTQYTGSAADAKQAFAGISMSEAAAAQSTADSAVASLASTVPNTRTVNGHALSGNVTITGTDITSGVLGSGTATSSGAKIELRTDTSTNWLGGTPPVLGKGELVSISDLGYLVIGDGVNNISQLVSTDPITKAFASYSTVQSYVASQGFANQTTTITAGTGLTGGGNLSANRTLSANFGTAAGTVTQGNDSRIVNAVPNTRTINSKPLTANVTLAASDVGAVATSSLVPVTIPSAGFHTDSLPSTVMSYAQITLGGTPLPGSLQVFVAGLLLWPPSYSLSGTTLTLNGLKSGQQVVIQYAYDQGLGAGPAVVTQTTIIDNFNRTNSTTTIGNTDTGQSWIVPVNAAGTQPVAGIISNQLYFVNTQSDGYAYVDAGTPNCTVTVQIAAGNTAGSLGLYVRGSDASNAYVANSAGLFQRKAGVTSSVSGWHISWSSISDGDTMQIVCSGATISVYRQAASTGSFTLLGSNTDTDFTTNTFFGVRNSTAGTAGRFDNFSISANS